MLFYQIILLSSSQRFAKTRAKRFSLCLFN
nr:MAG TPA: hypothetical protein [Caudoviricetes sp.]